MAIIVTYDGVASTTIPDLVIQHVDRQLFGDVRDVYEEVPGRESAWLFAEEPGDRTIEMPCFVLSTDKATRRSVIRQVALWVVKTDRKQLIVSDESDRYWEAKLASAPSLDEVIELGKFTLVWRTGPFAFSTSTSTQAVSNVSNTTTYTLPFSIPDEVAAYPAIRVTGVTAGSAGFTINLNGDILVYDAAVGIGEEVNFSSISYTATAGTDSDVNLTGAFDIADVSMAAVTGTFGVLLPGSNSITVTANGQQLAIDIVWRRRYI